VASRLATLSACGVLALAVAGCGDDDEEATTPAVESPTTEQTDTAGGGGDTVDVVMRDTAFVPQDVEVKSGQTILWTNEDPFAHTVTKEAGPGDDFDSGDVEGGGTYEQTFTDAGEIDYLCTIHPQQTGTITVK
jgi:plastocyanin